MRPCWSRGRSGHGFSERLRPIMQWRAGPAFAGTSPSQGHAIPEFDGNGFSQPVLLFFAVVPPHASNVGYNYSYASVDQQDWFGPVDVRIIHEKLSLTEWAAVGELIATLGIVISLLFVAYSINRNTEVNQASTENLILNNTPNRPTWSWPTRAWLRYLSRCAVPRPN